MLQPVRGLAVASLAEADEEHGPPHGPAMLTYVTELPTTLLDLVFDRCPQYRLLYSVTAGFDYYMNVCECGAKLGDHFLAERPGAPFVPLYDGDGETLTAEQLPLSEPLQVTARTVPCTPHLCEILADTASP